jgi:GNAT superfamily N-acetyltransferase
VIKGYEGLEVDVFFTPSFQALVDVKYAARAPGATALAPPFKDAFAAGFFEEKPAFDAAFEAEPPLALAELGEEVAAAGGRDGGALRVLRSTLAAAGPALRGLHARLQPLLLFFVDAAQSIDQDDPRWELLLAVETAGPGGAAEVVGFATLYNFWVFPDRRRLRVSQVLVLPPHQGRGVGSLLLRAASAVAERSGAVDLTVSATATRSWGVYMRVCGWVVGGGGVLLLGVRKAVCCMSDGDSGGSASPLLVSPASRRRRHHIELPRALPAQYEDPTDDLKTLRDRLDLQRMAALDGLPAAAEAHIAAALAAAAPGAAPAPATSGGQLVPPPAVLARLQRELRMNKGQARRMWETLLYATAAPAGPDAVAAVEGQVRAALGAAVAAAKQDSRGKSLRDFKGHGERPDFAMFRGAAPAGAVTAGAVVPVEGVSAELQGEEIEAAVAARVAEMRRVVGLAGAGGSESGEEGLEAIEEGEEEE